MKSYTTWKSIGTSAVFVGMIGVVSGAILASEGKKKLNSNNINSFSKGADQYDTGLAIASLSGAMFVGGIVLTIVGNRKIKLYKEKLNLGIIYDENAKGLRLVYKF